MPNVQSRVLVALLSLALTSACSSSSNPITGPSSPQPGPAVVHSFQVISGGLGQPLAGARITIEKTGASATTDATGKASFENVPADTRIKIEADDHQVSITKLHSSGLYELVGPRAGVPQDFIREFIIGEDIRGNTVKPRNNLLDVVLASDELRTPSIVSAFQRACEKIRGVGYGCNVHTSPIVRNGTMVTYRYGGPQGTTSLIWTGSSQGRMNDFDYTWRGPVSSLENEGVVLRRLTKPLGLNSHSQPEGAASKSHVASLDFSSWEKRTISLYMIRQEPTCWEDTVMLPVQGVNGDVCGYQAPFAR